MVWYLQAETVVAGLVSQGYRHAEQARDISSFDINRSIIQVSGFLISKASPKSNFRLFQFPPNFPVAQIDHTANTSKMIAKACKAAGSIPMSQSTR